MTEVYLDHAAAARPHPEVAAAMAEAVHLLWASPAAVHAPGARAAEALEAARGEVAALIGADPEDVVFTGGTTEARILAVRGLRSANRPLGGHAVASALEHPAVVWALRTDERDGMPWTRVGVDVRGRIDPAALAAAMRDDTALVSVHHGQGDVGVVQDAAALVAAARRRRPAARVHVDACETAGVLPLDVGALGADAVSIGGPAMGAPAWSGALWIRPGARLHPLLGGGLQEGAKRAGAEDLVAIAGLGCAARRARGRMEADAALRRERAERLAAGLLRIGGVRLNGPPVAERLPGHVQLSVEGVEGETLAVALAARGVAVSPGSACTAHAGKAAPALEAIGLEAPWTHSAVLFTAGPEVTEEDVERAVAATRDAVRALRAMSTLGR